MDKIRELSPKKLAEIVTFLAAVCTVLTFLGIHLSRSPGSRDGTTTSTTSQIPSNHSTVGSTPNSTPSPSVYWEGTVNIGPGVWLDFDTSPPSQEVSSAAVWYNPFQLNAGGDLPNTVFLALWNQSGVPGPAKCRELVATHSSGYVAIDTGEDVCIKTLQGRYGLLQVTSADTNQMGATVTIWNL